MLTRTICTLICASLPLFLQADSSKLSDLPAAEKSALGLDKLSPDQLQQLDKIIASRSKRSEKKARVTIDASITENSEGGKLLTLSNGLQVEVKKKDLKKSVNWKAEDLVRVTSCSKNGWVRIDNATSGKKVKAKVIAGELSALTK